MENHPLLLAELEDLSAIFTPLKTTSRIKYTCFNVSNNFIIFGASSGGLYVFCRAPCCFLQLLPNKEGSVTQVAISPDEKLIAFSTVKGIVCILEKSSHGAKQWVTTLEHQNEQVTCLQWNEGSNDLFVGDTSGKVSVVTVSVFPTKSMFQNPSFVLMQLDSKIVQMDFSSNMLLVSTLTKCYICDTTKEIFRQVGHKLRDGEYGACIFNTQINDEVIVDSEKSSDYSNLSHLKLLCARPGSRIWEVGIDGTVISTHHFKEALAVPPKKIYFLNDFNCQNINLCDNGISSNDLCKKFSANFPEQSFNFQKLHIILSKYCLTYKSNGIYIFDPEKATVVLWSNDIANIVDIKCLNDMIYVWSNYGKLYALSLITLEKFLVHLYFQKKYVELGQICLEYESFLLNQAINCSKLHILHDLGEKLKSDQLYEQLKPLINLYKDSAQKRKTQNAQILKSDMYLFNDKDQLCLRGKRGISSKLLSSSYLTSKCRSHSVSPERLQNGNFKHHGSCSSLPDLVKEGTAEENFNFSTEVEKLKEKQSLEEAIPVGSISCALADIRNAAKPSNDLIFALFDKILAWPSVNEAEEISFKLVEPLPLNIYFNKEDFNLITELFHSALKSKSLFDWLSKFKGDSLEEVVKIYPDFLAKYYPTEILYLDYKLSKVLKLFSVALKENEIIETIRSLEMQCYYCCLSEILSIYHDPTVFSLQNLNLANITSTPKLLNVSYFLMTVGQMEQCSKYSCKINLNEMFYLILKFEGKLIESGKSPELIELQCHTLFLSYLEKSSEEKELVISCSHVIEIYIINCLENIVNTASCDKELNCSCGFPRPGLQPSIMMFPKVGHALLDKNWPKDLAKCMEICGKVPYLWKYFICIRRNEPLYNLLPLILQLGDLQEFEKRATEVNENIFDVSMSHMVNLKNGNCLNCNKKIRVKSNTGILTEFGMLFIKLLGPKETLELYERYSSHISSKELDQSFYQSLIFSSIMEKHIKGLRKNVVDLLAGKNGEEPYRVPVLSEKLHHKVLFECNTQSAASAFHHWSVKVNFKKNCSVCSLPLDTKVLISEAGLVVFRCSHAFHSACLRRVDFECPVCKSKN